MHEQDERVMHHGREEAVASDKACLCGIYVLS